MNYAELLEKFKNLPSNVDRYESAPGAASPENAGEYINFLTGGLTGRDVEQEGLLPTSSPVDFIAGGLGAKLGSSMGKMAPEILGNEVGSVGRNVSRGSGPSIAESAATTESIIPKAAAPDITNANIFDPNIQLGGSSRLRGSIGDKNLSALEKLKAKMQSPAPEVPVAEVPIPQSTSQLPATEFRDATLRESSLPKTELRPTGATQVLPETELAPTQPSELQSLLDKFKGLSSGQKQAAGLTAAGLGTAGLASLKPEEEALLPQIPSDEEIPTPKTSDVITPQPVNSDPSLFDAVSGQYRESQEAGDVGESTGGAASQLASMRAKLSEKTGAAPGISEPNATPETLAPIAPEKQGTQLGTEQALRDAQKKAAMMELFGGLSDVGANLKNANDSILSMFTSKPIGGNWKSGGDTLRAQGKQFIQNQKDLVENQDNDPKSQTSVAMRQMFDKMGFPFNENTSAADLVKQYPGAANIYTQVKAQEARKEENRFKAGESAKQRQADRETKMDIAALSREEKKAAKTEKLNDKQRSFVQGLRKEATSGQYGKAYESFAVANRMTDALSQFAKNPTGYTDYGTLMGGLKALQGDQSVVREAEIKLGQNAAPFFTKVQNLIERQTSGKSLTPEQRKDIVSATKILADASKTSYRLAVAPLLEQANEEGIDPNLIFAKGIVDSPAKQQESQSTRKQLPDGRFVELDNGRWKVIK